MIVDELLKCHVVFLLVENESKKNMRSAGIIRKKKKMNPNV